MDTIFSIIFILISSAFYTAISLKFLHVFQLSSYRINGVVNWLKFTHFEHILRFVAYAFFSTGLTIVTILAFPFEFIKYLSYVFFFGFGILFLILSYGKKVKTPLIITSRMKRLIITNAFVSLGFAFGAWGLSLTPVSVAGYSIVIALVPLSCLISFGIMYYPEKLIARSYIIDATDEIEKLKIDGLKVVGITGSYGKTTAKNILFAMLSTKYRVCASPASYNTPLGICRTVNDHLESGDEILIVEMGARYKRDIAELCEIAKPDFGIITGVGNQHLETFGSEEDIANTKFELSEYITDGLVAFNCSDNGAKALADRRANNKIIINDRDGDITYSDVKYNKNGCSFTLSYKDETVNVKTSLLGDYVPALISTCAGIAVHLDVPLCACARAVEYFKPVPHRQELIVSGNKTIIDDAYNANTVGARSALATLSLFEGTKIIVTPGLVELGDYEATANEEFGAHIAKVCDYAIFVGLRGKFMTKGAINAGMDATRIIGVKSLSEAQKWLENYTDEATVLFENDLPDNY
ncbi:MAG: UDP-N-acetylmuramoyl-tripeptide--D-alanyl-D-alanine ligase [Clostridia bacterium]|nr:UDP-N-acetylmuramoyl-tripeptide--D-alanyl-D-alanine ligase [Clostridia bacterium]